MGHLSTYLGPLTRPLWLIASSTIKTGDADQLVSHEVDQLGGITMYVARDPTSAAANVRGSHRPIVLLECGRPKRQAGL